MATLIDLNFWIAAFILVIVLRIVPVRRTLCFGICNLLVLWFWMGTAVALTAAGLTLIFWGILRCSGYLEGRRRILSAVSILVTACLVLLFIVHKINLEFSHLIKPLENDGRWQLSGMLLATLGSLSISYVVLRAYDMSAAVLRNKNDLLDPLSCLGFLFPFHMLLAGPISSYKEHLRIDQPGGLSPDPHWFLLSASDIATGLVLKYVVCEYMRIFAFGPQGMIEVRSIFDTAYLFIYVFFDFAGYSAIALGIGRLMGIPTPRNFNAPFVAKTVTEFFTRWHVSLGTFIQQNVYTPLLIFLVRAWGVKRAIWAGLVALLVSWTIVGLWHRLSIGFLVYGLSMMAWIWAEKLIRDRVLRCSWSHHWAANYAAKVLGPVYVFVGMTLMLHPISKELFTL